MPTSCSRKFSPTYSHLQISVLCSLHTARSILPELHYISHAIKFTCLSIQFIQLVVCMGRAARRPGPNRAVNSVLKKRAGPFRFSPNNFLRQLVIYIFQYPKFRVCNGPGRKFERWKRAGPKTGWTFEYWKPWKFNFLFMACALYVNLWTFHIVYFYAYFYDTEYYLLV
jgi:hypothetical protein